MKYKFLFLAFSFTISFCKIFPQCTIIPFSVPNPAAGAVMPRVMHFCEQDMVSSPELQVLPMTEIEMRNILYQVDSFDLLNIQYLPAFADYVCYDPQCRFRAGNWTCMAINFTGIIPSIIGLDSVNEYDMSWEIRLWAKSGGNSYTLDTILYNQTRIIIHRYGCYQWWGQSPNVCRIITGKVYFDENQNGNKDSIEPYLPDQSVIIEPNNEIAFTNSRGEYIFIKDSGTYIVRYLPSQIWDISSSDTSFNINVSNSNITLPDFGVKANDTSLFSINQAVGRMICNHTITFYIVCKNNGSTLGSGLVGINLNSILTPVNFYPIYDSTSVNGYYWYTGQMSPGDQKLFRVSANVPNSNFHGDTISQVSVFKMSSFLYTDTLEQILFCSYDPNDKVVDPYGVGPEHYTLMNEILRYTIHFQNTGNDTAYNIFIRDTLSPDLDISSFKMLAASHSVSTTLDLNGALQFRFDNILLPDSGHSRDLSQGFVTYSIKPRTGLLNNTPITNTAAIYFDLNPPIQTDTTLNTMVYSIPNGIGEKQPDLPEQLIMYPNPTTGRIKIIPPKSAIPFKLEIYTVEGQLVFSQETIEKEANLNLMKIGMYIVKVFNDRYVFNGKIVVY